MKFTGISAALLSVVTCVAQRCIASSDPVNDWTIRAGDRWCAVGDSITHAGDWTRLINLFQVTRFPESRYEFFNCGIGGDTAIGATHRLDWDVDAQKPTRATIMFGVNDSWWESNNRMHHAEFIDSIQRLTQDLQARNCSVLLILPPPYEDAAQGATPVDPARQILPRYVDELRRYAAMSKVSLLDFYSPMREISVRMRVGDPTFSLLGPDRIHPNAAGYFVMAYLFLKHEHSPSRASDASLDIASGKFAHLANADAKALVINDDGTEFSLRERSLPFPTQDIPATTLALVPFVRELNQELLHVAHLKAGTYRIQIDDERVGEFGADELSAGINLAAFATPQMKQAQHIAVLIARRHEVTRELRYILMIELGELKHRYPVDDVRDAKVQVDQRLAGEGNPAVHKSFDDYMNYKAAESKLTGEARALTEQVFKDNRCAWHRVSIRRVEPTPASVPK